MLSVTRRTLLGSIKRFTLSVNTMARPTAPEEHLCDLVTKGFTDAEFYERNRPDYVPETVDTVVSMLLENHPSVSGGECDILELGAGTGKFTRHLPQRLPKERTFIASEPMTDFITKLQKECPNVAARQFSAESIPLPDNSVQGIVAVQCFHWFANQRAVDEITRVLKPGGNLVLLWLVKDMKVNWQRDMVNRMYRDLDTTERELQYISLTWKKFMESYKGLTLKSRLILDYTTKEKTKESIMDNFASVSVIIRMSEKDRKIILSEMRSILDTDPETKDKHKVPVVMFTDICHYVKPL